MSAATLRERYTGFFSYQKIAGNPIFHRFLWTLDHCEGNFNRFSPEDHLIGVSLHLQSICFKFKSSSIFRSLKNRFIFLSDFCLMPHTLILLVIKVFCQFHGCFLMVVWNSNYVPSRVAISRLTWREIRLGRSLITKEFHQIAPQIRK